MTIQDIKPLYIYKLNKIILTNKSYLDFFKVNNDDFMGISETNNLDYLNNVLKITYVDV
jgi:hypothetical protein